MGSRGRASGSELSLVIGGVETGQRPAAPSDLSSEEAVEWTAITGKLPGHYFQHALALLAQFCKHVVRARRLAQWIARIEDSDGFDAKEYLEVLSAEAEQSRVIASLREIATCTLNGAGPSAPSHCVIRTTMGRVAKA